jgi:hypothetical protein
MLGGCPREQRLKFNAITRLYWKPLQRINSRLAIPHFTDDPIMEGQEKIGNR